MCDFIALTRCCELIKFFTFYMYLLAICLHYEVTMCNFNCVVVQRKMRPEKKSADDGEGDGDVIDSAAESVIVDEVLQLLQLVLKRAAATFRQIRRLSLWGSTGAAVIGRVRDSFTRVLYCHLQMSSQNYWL